MYNVFMKNALILHGAGNNSQGNWFPWLKQELESKGYTVWSPDLPNANEPNQKQWLEAIFSNKEWKFNDESLIVGHSAGATLILRILESLSDGVQINKAILVAGPVKIGEKHPEFFQYKRDLVRNPFAWEKIKKSAKSFYFIYSDNDPYECGQENGEITQEYLGRNLIVKSGEAHFNLEKSPRYREFPFLLSLIN